MSDDKNPPNPLTAEEYYARAEKHFKGGNYDDAITDLTEVIRLSPNHFNAFIYRGNIWFTKTQYDKAINDYSEAIRLEPNDAGVWYNRGNVWFIQGEDDLAITDYNEAIRLEPEFVRALINRGNAWYKKGDFDQTIADYNEAVHLEPDNATTWLGRGNAWLRKGENDLAIADYNEAIRRQPDNALAWNGRGIAWRIKGELDKSLTDHNKAIQIKPSFAYFWVSRGNVWLVKGEFDKAVTDCNEALRLEPDNSYAQTTINLAQEGKEGQGKTVNEQTKAPPWTSEEKEIIRNQTVANMMQITEPERRTIAEDIKKEYSEQLEKELRAAVERIIKDTEEFRGDYKSNMKYARWLRIIAMGALGLIGLGIAIIFWFIYCLEKNSLGEWGLIPWIPVVTAMSVPFIAAWWMLQRWSFELKTLAYGLHRKAILEERILLFFNNDAERLKEMQKLYIVHWMEKSPLEVMLAIGGKSKSKGNSPASTLLSKVIDSVKTLDKGSN